MKEYQIKLLVYNIIVVSAWFKIAVYSITNLVEGLGLLELFSLDEIYLLTN